MQYRVMNLDLHILIVTLHIYILSFKQIPSLVSEIFKYMFKFKNRSQFLPSSVTLTLIRQRGYIGSAHLLVEVSILAKIKENLSISVWLTERTRHNVLYLIVWYLTFNCDNYLELTHGQHGFCTALVEVNISAKFEENLSIGIGFIERTRQ